MMSPLSPTSVAKELGSFTRREFAEGIGVTPLAAGRYLARLEEDERITRDGRTYRWDPIEDRAPDTPSPHKNDDPRILARKLDSFTIDFYAHTAEISIEAARTRIKKMVKDKVVRYSGEKEWRDTGPPAMIFEAIPLPKQKVERRSHTHGEAERHRVEGKRMERTGQIAGTGKHRTDYPGDPMMKLLAERAVEAGGKVKRNGSDHFKVTLPNGKIVGLANTPDSSAWKKAAAAMRRNGFDPGV